MQYWPMKKRRYHPIPCTASETEEDRRITLAGKEEVQYRRLTTLERQFQEGVERNKLEGVTVKYVTERFLQSFDRRSHSYVDVNTDSASVEPVLGRHIESGIRRITCNEDTDLYCRMQKA